MQRCRGRGDGDAWLGKAARLLALDGAAHRLPEIQLRPGGNIGAEADADARVEMFAEGHDAAGEVEVRRGAMRDRGAALGKHGALALREMDAVREDRLRPGQPGLFIHSRVVRRLWKKMPHAFAFLAVLGEGRPPVAAELPRPLARRWPEP